MIPQCTGVAESAYTGCTLNYMDVHARCNGKMIRRSGSAHYPTKLLMALEVRRQVTAIVGAAAVNMAEMMAGPPPAETSSTVSSAAAEPELTRAEMQWLNDWVDEQERPFDVTQAEAEAALAKHRKEVSGSGSAAADGFALIKATALKQAKHKAAQMRHQQALADLQRAEAELPQKQQRLEEPPARLDAAPNFHLYSSYDHSKFQELEVKEQKRRAVLPDPNLRQRDMHGDEYRWFTHWRRGIQGALQSWVKGSLGAVAYMLARSAERFGVVDELADELGLLRKEASKKARAALYICRRLREALAVLKHCKTEAQREDYHVVMACCAVRRTPDDTDPDHMYVQVANLLDVSPYGRCVILAPCLPAHLPAAACPTRMTPPSPRSRCFACAVRWDKVAKVYRPRPFEQATRARAKSDQHVSRHQVPARQERERHHALLRWQRSACWRPRAAGHDIKVCLGRVLLQARLLRRGQRPYDLLRGGGRGGVHRLRLARRGQRWCASPPALTCAATREQEAEWPPILGRVEGARHEDLPRRVRDKSPARRTSGASALRRMCTSRHRR